MITKQNFKIDFYLIIIHYYLGSTHNSNLNFLKIEVILLINKLISIDFKFLIILNLIIDHNYHF